MEQENMLKPEEEIKTTELAETEPVSTDLPSEAEATATEVQKEKNEIPEVDFSQLDTEEFVRQAQKLIENYPVNSIKDIIESLPEKFEAQYKKEYDEALAAFTADGDSPEGFEFKNNTKERFNTLYKLYKDKKISALRQIEAEREENLKIKLGLIEELKALVQKEESLGKTFQEFRDIQERWRNTGMVPQAQLNGLLETYHLHVENFYNYIKINKELRDLDLKRNLDAKTQLCEEAERLDEENNIAESYKQLQTLHARWKEIGPTAKEHQEVVWDRFKAASNKINEKYYKFFESLKQEQENNLKIKSEICEKIAAIAAAEHNTISEWNKLAQTVLDLQEQWKRQGAVPIKERNKLFKKYRTACDTFFDKKREFYKQISEELNKNLEVKIQLCEKVEAIKDSTDWKGTTDKIIAYQAEWKKIGPVPQKHSNKIWNRFRSACDTFFNNKNAFYKEINGEQEKNLELKKALIEEIKQFIPSNDSESDLKALKEFQSRWSKIGFVPIKYKNSLQEEFKNTLNHWFDKLNLDEFDKNLARFRAKLSSIDSGDNKEYKIINEREKLITQIRQVENEINTYENNIGFISKSSKSQGLLNELNSKIEKTKQRLVLLQEKLKALDSLI